MKKQYRIEVKDGWINRLLDELNIWRVSPSRYQCEGGVILTSDSNVVDVATETFINAPHLITITQAKVKP